MGKDFCKSFHSLFRLGVLDFVCLRNGLHIPPRHPLQLLIISLTVMGYLNLLKL